MEYLSFTEFKKIRQRNLVESSNALYEIGDSSNPFKWTTNTNLKSWVESFQAFKEFIAPDKEREKKTAVYEAQIGVADEAIDINQVNYGNAAIEYFEAMQKADDPIKNWFIKNGLAERISSEAPSNDSETTKKDIEALLSKMEKATAEEITFARHIDDVSNLAQAFIDLLKEYGHSENMEGFFRVDAQTEGLLFFLKDVVNRPRPYQLAKYYNYPLYPLMRTDAMTAAYPSGHALTAFVLSEYYSRKYPDAAIDLKALGERIANTRELTGIHYPSDTEISREICKIICENNLLEG